MGQADLLGVLQTLTVGDQIEITFRRNASRTTGQIVRKAGAFTFSKETQAELDRVGHVSELITARLRLQVGARRLQWFVESVGPDVRECKRIPLRFCA